MKREYFLLSAASCKDALIRYKIAKDDALSSRRDILTEFRCDEIVRVRRAGIGLAFRQSVSRNGFHGPQRIEEGYWMIKPDMNTALGRDAINKLHDYAHLMEMTSGCLEKCLGIYGLAVEGDVMYYVNARPMTDGRVFITLPQGEWAKTDPYGVELDVPVIPLDAEQIDEVAALIVLADIAKQSIEAL